MLSRDIQCGGGTFFTKPPKAPAIDKLQFKCPDEKCWELPEDKREEHGPSQGLGKTPRRRGCWS